MASNKIIGREYEQSLIRSYLESGKSELIAVYGRRRVGKTYLVRSIFNSQFDFAFTGMYNVTRAVHLAQFQKSLEKYSGKRVGRLKDWFEAFDALRGYLESLSKGRIVVFLDEIPWMDTPKSNFLAAFGQFWNDWASIRKNFKLFVCGSATTWMLSKFIGDKGGIYGRVCRSIWLAPFTLGETERFLKEIKGIEMNRHQLLQAYMIMGGIPYYLDMLIKGMPLNVCIDDLFFRQGAPLRTEFDFLFRSLFKDSKIYRNIVETLATKLKGMTRQEILEAVNLKEGGDLTDVLDNLVKCDFIRRYTAIGKSERDVMYQLTDLFSLFHIKFVANNNGQDDHLWSKLSGKGQMTSWSGYAFEQVCLHHLPQIKYALSIGGVISNIHSWSCKPFIDKNGVKWKGAQIDLLIDRADEVINICEVKYVSDRYEIDADYEERLRNRATLFRNVTKTKKALYHTFITTYGVAQNIHSGIVQSEVTMEQLFV
ncbi:MAG: AAA family ATPase [Bacteroidaceae bacterium]|nr:AAA family ATPase [Bacteroidaceae bacterium]